MKKAISLSLPKFGEEELEALKGPLNSGWVTSGPFVEEFELAFAKMHNVKHAVAVSNCTAALHLAVKSVGIGSGDKVLVPAFSWVSTANAVRYCDGEIVFVDVERDTYNIDIEDLILKLNDDIKAIIPVHLFGMCSNMDAVKELCSNIPIIEDAACASGATYQGQMAGSLADVGCFSFHPRKSITTGEGGMLTTNNDQIAAKLRKWRNHGSYIHPNDLIDGAKPHTMPDVIDVGYNYRLTDIQACIGVEQLKKMKGFINERDVIADIYDVAFENIDWINIPHRPKGYGHSWQAYVVTLNETAPISRNDFMEALLTKGVQTRPGTQALHMLTYYAQRYNLKPEDYPGTEFVFKQSVALPMHNQLTTTDQKRVIEVIRALA
jgi:perosamine synthetase